MVVETDSVVKLISNEVLSSWERRSLLDAALLRELIGKHLFNTLMLTYIFQENI